jgi:hypothetical protein
VARAQTGGPPDLRMDTAWLLAVWHLTCLRTLPPTRAWRIKRGGVTDYSAPCPTQSLCFEVNVGPCLLRGDYNADAPVTLAGLYVRVVQCFWAAPVASCAPYGQYSWTGTAASFYELTWNIPRTPSDPSLLDYAHTAAH